MLEFLFSFRGRVGRRAYVLTGLVWVIGLHLPALLYLYRAFNRPGFPGAIRPGEAAGRAADGAGSAFFTALGGSADAALRGDPWEIAMVALVVLCAWSFAALSVRRLHDLGQSGWCVLLALVPGVGPWALLVLLGALHSGAPVAHPPERPVYA